MLDVACLAWIQSKHGSNIYLASFCPDGYDSPYEGQDLTVKFQGLTWPLGLTLTPIVCNILYAIS